MHDHQPAVTTDAITVRRTRNRIRTLARLSTGCVAVLGISLLSTVPGHADSSPSVTACQMSAVVSIDGTGLTTTASTFTYNFFGQLVSSVGSPVPACGSSNPSVPTGTSTLNAGNAAIVRVRGTDAAGPWYVDYALPQSVGFGSCALTTSAGTALSLWPDGTFTVYNYSTVGIGSLWLVGGQVVKDATLLETDFSGTPPADTPTTFTATTNNPAFPVHSRLSGQMAFIDELADPTCSGTTFGGLNGPLEITSQTN